MEDKSEIFSKRLLKAVILNIVLQCVLAVILVLLIQVEFLHPISWITSTLNDIFSWKMSLNVILLLLISFFQAYIYGTYYTMQIPKYFTRFAIFIHMFSLQNIIFMILYSLNGYFALSLYSSLAKGNYNVLKKNCEKYDGQCLTEQSLFLQFGGMWMGLFYFLNNHILSKSVLVFPHIYQEKFQQIKLVISNILATGFQHSIMPVIYYCIFYYLWGSKPRSVVSEVYGLYLEDPPLDNIINLLSSGIWIGLWFYTSLFFISVYTMKTVFNIVLTEPMKFPVQSNSAQNLASVLSGGAHFSGHLAAQDLKILSMTDPARRAEIFTLSQPGGHPRNWKNILDNCLHMINKFTSDLDSLSAEPKDGNYLQNKTLLNNTIPSTPLSPYSGTIRNMAQSPYLYKLQDESKSKQENVVVVKMKEEFNIFLKKLCQKPGINYLFGELTDTKLRCILIEAQPVMWTCEGLAHLTAASLKEDNYGLVQNDLPVIITSLINLKQSLDKLTKPGLVPRKHILNDSFTLKTKAAMLSSVKRSLYKIILTFSKYINEISLEPDILAVTQTFLLCKES
ncbi:nucleoporin NDC1 [Aricia agestis]|uniref:nucleoporin NDC1 n=1 Tax=Aricia agestis TaxID=91739 RepID=UPI001C201CC2|nr:nucleoporin NDC1 [Aricia agestis]